LRAHRSGDNGLMEARNAAVIRKHIGFGHIGLQHAEAFDQFHRPCAVPLLLIEPNGKHRRVYRRWATPFELLQEVPRCVDFLRSGLTLAEFARFAAQQSDTEAALDMHRAKHQLMHRIAKLSA